MSTNSFVMPNDMSDLCRVCLQLPEESQYLDLTTIYDEEDNLTYGECFTTCTQIDLYAGEGVPHNLCKSCGLELQMSYDFHKKIEESNRVIEQYQRQIKVQKANGIELMASNEPSENLNLDGEDKGPTVQLQIVTNDKYVVTNDEQLTGSFEDMDEDCIVQQANEQVFLTSSDAKEEADEMFIINEISHTEANLQHQELVPSDRSKSSVDTNENDERIDVEDHLEMDDYQNLEALEDEETETLQIKYGENTIPLHVLTKFKIQSGENEEFVEYTEDYNEEEVEEEEGEREELYEVAHVQETNEKDTEVHLRWQENVVAVANKEHLPIELSDDEEEGVKFIHIYSKGKNNESQETINESSQDETTEALSTKAAEGKINQRTERKRHVGSYSCNYCHRVYPNYSRMKTHRRCHETDRPKFSCSHCGRMYATKQARDCHIRTAHEKSGYTCNICSKVFAIRKSLEIHVRYHTGDFPYACKLCDRKFAQACHLNTHVNVKHNKIRFSCEYPNCGKFFTSSSSLRNHEYTHGIMPFECEYCQQGYPAKSKLRIHITRKHGFDISNDQLENMRKFHVIRSKVNLVQFVDP